MRPLLARLLLALAIVLFQHGAVAHVLVHAGEETQHRHDGDFHAPHGCDACHAYLAADGGEPPPSLIDSAAADADTAAPPDHLPAKHAAPAKPFDSQAPPARS